MQSADQGVIIHTLLTSNGPSVWWIVYLKDILVLTFKRQGIYEVMRNPARDSFRYHYLFFVRQVHVP